MTYISVLCILKVSVMFVNSINNFRAIAIILIVFAHMFGFSGLEYHGVNLPFHAGAIINLIAGGTALFVFISGFMFHHVFYEKYNFKKFIKNKFKNIFIPYLLLGVIPVFLYIYFNKNVYGGYFLPTGNGALFEYIIPAFKYYWTGAFLVAYWYIPFVLVVFLLSPLHFIFVSQSLFCQFLIVFILLFVSIFIHRPIDNLSVFQSVIYYMPIYLYGITFSKNKDLFYRVLDKYLPWLFLSIVILSFYQTYIGHIGNYHKPAMLFNGIDVLLIQKLLMCNFLAVWLHRYEGVEHRYISVLASTSFTVFFLHPFIIWGITKIKTSSVIDFLSSNYPWLLLFLSTFIVILICVAIAICVKRLLPKYSRYLIGY